LTVRQRAEIIELTERATSEGEITKAQCNTIRSALQKGLRISPVILKHVGYGGGYSRIDALDMMQKSFDAGTLSFREHSILEDRLNRKQMSPSEVVKALRHREAKQNTEAGELKKNFGTDSGPEVRRRVLDVLDKSLSYGELSLRECSVMEDELNKGVSASKILKSIEARRKNKTADEQLIKISREKNSPGVRSRLNKSNDVDLDVLFNRNLSGEQEVFLRHFPAVGFGVASLIAKSCNSHGR